jgi:phage recombination protein Bet
MSESNPTPPGGDTLRKLFFPDLSDEDMAHVLAFCERRGLDPWSRHVHAKFQWDALAKKARLSIMVTIDGLRARAAVTGAYAGNDGPQFVEAEGHPLLARATVHRLVGGLPRAYTAEARWASYYPADGDATAWDRMPHVMLAKVAEAVALRKGFPELGGLYTVDEMAQAPDAQPPRPWEPGGREEAQPQPVASQATAADGEPPPDTRRQLELRMIDLRFRTPEQRRQALAKFLALWPGVYAENEQEWCRRVWNLVSRNPIQYGADAA